MNIPVETKPALWGMAGGAVLLAVIGFGWGGWTTSSKAEAMASMRASDAVVVALAPVCADKFRHASDAEANLTALRKVESWSQGEFVEKGGWASGVGKDDSAQRSAVGKACATLLIGA